MHESIILHIVEIISIESDMWNSADGESDNECNKFVGTDNTIVPPLLSPEEGSMLFSFEKM